MAHMIEMVDGKASMAYAGELPWHGLGTKVDPNVTPDEMLIAAKLNWTVTKRPLTFEFNGKQKPALDRQALVRESDGKVLDVVSGGWNPLQNHEAFEFFSEFVQAGSMEMHTAGSLREGQLVWGLAKVNDAFEVFKDDVVEQYLLFTNPHKFGAAIDVRMTPIRVVCNNTLTLSLSGRGDRMIKVNHRRGFDAEMVKETLGVAKEKLNTYRDAASFLASKTFTKDKLTEYFITVFPSLSKANDNEKASRGAVRALEALDTQPGAQYGRGTWWQAYNTVTYLTDHELGRSTDTRLTSAWYGINRERKLRALETAVEYAKAA